MNHKIKYSAEHFDKLIRYRCAFLSGVGGALLISVAIGFALIGWSEIASASPPDENLALPIPYESINEAANPGGTTVNPAEKAATPGSATAIPEEQATNPGSATAIPGEQTATPRSATANPAEQAAKTRRTDGSRPNIVILTADDLGVGDVSCYYARDIKTPNIDKIARRGMRLGWFCTPISDDRAAQRALLTGTRFFNQISEQNLGHVARQNQYRSCFLGQWLLGATDDQLPLSADFDSFWGIAVSPDQSPFHPIAGNSLPAQKLYENETIIGYNPNLGRFTDELTARAIRFIALCDDSAPFFLHVAYTAPHVPLQFVPDSPDGPESPTGPDSPESGAKDKPERGIYGQIVEQLDGAVGRILSALEQKNLARNTLVVFLSDNGPWLSYGAHAGSAGPLREGKGTIWEGGVRVPCVLQWPAVVPPKSDYNYFTTTLDLSLTIAQLLSGQTPVPPAYGKQPSETDIPAATANPADNPADNSAGNSPKESELANAASAPDSAPGSVPDSDLTPQPAEEQAAANRQTNNASEPFSGGTDDDRYAPNAFPVPESFSRAEGVSLLPILSGPPFRAADTKPFVYYLPSGEVGAVRLGSWKIVRPHEYPGWNKNNVSQTPGCPGAYTIEKTGWELYSLKSDSSAESTDESANQPQIIEAVRKALKE